MTESKLNKRLYTDVNRLRLLNKATGQPKFELEQSPFNDDDEPSVESQDIIIVGKIFPDSEVFKEGAFRIEMKLPTNFPLDPPEVRFLTPIYHPNVAQDGKFCHDLLKKTAKWTPTTSLVDVVKAVVEHIDKPDIDYSLSLTLGREYTDNRPEFNRKALEYVKSHALKRT